MLQFLTNLLWTPTNPKLKKMNIYYFWQPFENHSIIKMVVSLQREPHLINPFSSKIEISIIFTDTDCNNFLFNWLYIKTSRTFRSESDFCTREVWVTGWCCGLVTIVSPQQNVSEILPNEFEYIMILTVRSVLELSRCGGCDSYSFSDLKKSLLFYS